MQVILFEKMKILKNFYNLVKTKDNQNHQLKHKEISNFDNADFRDEDFKRNILFTIIFLFLAFLFIFLYIFFKYNVSEEDDEMREELPPLRIVVPYPNNSINIDDYEILKYKIKVGDNLTNVLTKEVGIPTADAINILEALKNVFNVSQLRAGQTITIKYRTLIDQNKDGNISEKVILEELVINTNEKDMEVIVSLGKDNIYEARKSKILLNKNYLKYKVKINDSLYADGIEAGIPAGVMIEFIKLFSFDIDFQRDLRKGDSFEILFESYTTDSGKKIKDGNILFASLENQGTKYEMYRYNPNNNPNYFNKNGQSVQKSLLKTPINGARISSGFSTRRKHPVLGYTRAHKGIDFAAPIGTPFYAAGSGTVTKVVKNCKVGQRRCNGGFGNYISVRHTNNYTTEYAHISRISNNIKVGTKVKQGQTIAYVGNTGITTGPHLHYGVVYNGERINPNRVKSLPSIKLVGKDLINFQKEVEKIDLYRLNIPNQNLRLKK